MSINITPLDQQIHLKRFEPEFGGSTYDHSGHPVTGWRAERRRAESVASANRIQSDPVIETNAPATAGNWIAKVVNRFITPRFAG